MIKITLSVKSPSSVTETYDGGVIQTPFKDLKYIKQSSVNTYAISRNYISHKPTGIECRNFNFNLPVGAVVKKVIVEYKHKKFANRNNTPVSSAKSYPNFPAPTISLLGNVGSVNGKGQAPTKSWKHNTKTFNVDLDRTIVNSSSFGVKFQYFKQTNKVTGFIGIMYIDIKLEYVMPNFGLGISKVSGGYNQEEYTVEATLSNKNLTNYNPSTVISAPLGFSVKEVKGQGSWVVNTARDVTWTSRLNSKTGNNKIQIVYEVDVTYTGSNDTYNGTITGGVSYGNVTANHNVTIIDKPVSASETVEDPTPIVLDPQAVPENLEVLKVEVNEEFQMDLTFEDYNNPKVLLYGCDAPNGDYSNISKDNYKKGILIYTTVFHQTDYRNLNYMGSTNGVDEYRPFVYDVNNALMQNSFKCDAVGFYSILIYSQDDSRLLKQVNIDVRPSGLGNPFNSIVSLSEEELNRLGDGYSYTAQTFLKEVTNEAIVRDWKHNFRIGVFNNRIEENVKPILEIPENAYSNITYCRINFPCLDEDSITKMRITASDAVYYEYARENITLAGMFNENATIINKGTGRYIIFRAIYGNEKFNIGIDFLDNENNVLISTIFHLDYENQIIECENNEYDFTDYDNLTSEYMIENADYWSNAPKDPNNYDNLECQFMYDKDYPLYIIVTGDYSEADNPASIVFTNPALIETDVYKEYESTGTYFTPINDVISDENNSEVSIESQNHSTPIIAYDINVDDGFGTTDDLGIRGIELRGDIEQSDELILFATLKSPTGAVGNRSIKINDTNDTADGTNTFKIGGNGDLWSFNTLDMINLERWQVELYASNVLGENTANISISNLQLIFYVEQVESQDYAMKVDGENIAFYGAIINDIEIPAGIETETNYLNVDGTDINEAYSQNIREKVITVELTIDSCDLEAATLSLQQLTKLLLNERDKYNRPIPKRVEFSHYPDEYWEYIIEDTLNTTVELTGYRIQAKLTIPSGTSYLKQSVTTNTVGYVQGITSVKPNIILKPSGTLIEITENITSQKFTINCSEDYTDKIIEIDCNNRIVWLKTDEDDNEPININNKVDYNVDWFVLHGEYNFTSSNATIRTIDYIERR